MKIAYEPATSSTGALNVTIMLMFLAAPETLNTTDITQPTYTVDTFACDDQVLNVTIQSGMKTAQVEIMPTFILNLGPGNHSYFTIQDGKSCIVQVNVHWGGESQLHQ